MFWETARVHFETMNDTDNESRTESKIVAMHPDCSNTPREYSLCGVLW